MRCTDVPSVFSKANAIAIAVSSLPLGHIICNPTGIFELSSDTGIVIAQSFRRLTVLVFRTQKKLAERCTSGSTISNILGGVIGRVGPTLA